MCQRPFCEFVINFTFSPIFLGPVVNVLYNFTLPVCPKSALMHSFCVCKISKRCVESAVVWTDLNEDMFIRKRVPFSMFKRPWRVYFLVSRIGTCETLCIHLRAMCVQIFEGFGGFRLNPEYQYGHLRVSICAVFEKLVRIFR